jgi:hypothetical protein
MDQLFWAGAIYFLELQDNGLPEQNLVNSALIRSAGKPASRWSRRMTAIT